MKKIIILAQCFPPSSRAASFRTEGWAKYLTRFGYYPIVFTVSDNRNSSAKVFRGRNYEVHRIFCKPTIIEAARLRFSGTLLGKICGLLDKILYNRLFYSPFSCLIPEVIGYAAANSVCLMVATAPSFALFSVADRISRETGINWLADYRDDWTTSDLPSSVLDRLVLLLEKPLERKVLKSSSAFISVSPHYVKKIQSFLGVNGYVVENSFEPSRFAGLKSRLSANQFLAPPGSLNLIYPGTLYDTQDVSYFLEMLVCLEELLPQKLSVLFLGVVSRAAAENHLFNYLMGRGVISVKSRISKQSADRYLLEADVAIYIAHLDRYRQALPGIPSSKLYEYVGAQVPVALAPSDNDIAESTLSKCKLALISSTPRGLAWKIYSYYASRHSKVKCNHSTPEFIYESYSRKNMARRLAAVLEDMQNPGHA